MDSTAILTPPSISLSGILLLAKNPIVPKDQNMKIHQHYIYMRRAFIPFPRGTTTAVATSK